VLEILRGATDLSSSSDELVAQAASWPEMYHLNPARANVIRPLELSAQDTVLEIGAGCGAITRYLGEQCGAVDAIEPMRTALGALESGPGISRTWRSTSGSSMTCRSQRPTTSS